MEEVSDYYQNRGRFDEVITLMESGLGLERAHMGIFTELGSLYARYRPEKLMEHLKLFSTRINIPKLIRVCDEQQHWKELTYLYVTYDEFDNAATTIMAHSPEAWEHNQVRLLGSLGDSPNAFVLPCCMHRGTSGTTVTAHAKMHTAGLQSLVTVSTVHTAILCDLSPCTSGAASSTTRPLAS